MHEIQMDRELWEKVLAEADNTYGGVGKRPTCRSLFSKEVRQQFDAFRQKNTKFLCEVPSQTVNDSGQAKSQEDSPYLSALNGQPAASISCEDLLVTLSDGMTCIEEAHQPCGRKATEGLVWILADVNRLWKSACYSSCLCHEGIQLRLMHYEVNV